MNDLPQGESEERGGQSLPYLPRLGQLLVRLPPIYRFTHDIVRFVSHVAMLGDGATTPPTILVTKYLHEYRYYCTRYVYTKADSKGMYLVCRFCSVQ